MGKTSSVFVTLLLAVVMIVVDTQSLSVQAGQSNSTSPPTPTFAPNYKVRGRLSLPYAELNEPFTAYYDKDNLRSRTDYYSDEYKVYQFGPGHEPTGIPKSAYGYVYKLVYVPLSFNQPQPELVKHSKSSEWLERVKTSAKQAYDKIRHLNDNAAAQTKQVCFGSPGFVGSTIAPQSVLPNLNSFTYDSTGPCPSVSVEHRRAKCELWRYSNSVGEKKNVYKFWVKRDNQNNVVIPVHYYMLGFDSLLGSHYDRYDISYFDYKVNGAADEAFALDVKGAKCGPMPGPGDDPSESERRAHIVVQNPIHEYVVQPQRYDHIDSHFKKFVQEHDKSYSNRGEERKAWFNFLHNLRFILGKNRQLKEYKLQVNQYADANIKDLGYLRRRMHTQGYNGGMDYAKHHKQLKSGNKADQLPESFDWTAYGAVTPVKDQAVCGSCWSFGTTGAVEGANFVKTGKLQRLSQQQLIDCSWQYGNNGCDGGEDFRAYNYIINAGGLSTEEDYGHYKAIDGKCHDQSVKKPVKITGFYNVTAGDAEALKHALVNYGPVSVGIDASRPTFTFYSHGAYYDEKCATSPDSLDHAVLVVGYLKINNTLVWKVKNSWSTYWGNDGYIYMSAEKNTCGILDAPTIPVIA